MTVVHASLDVPPSRIWSQLKHVNREFVVRRVESGNWDLAVDMARLSFASIQNTSTNDLLIQDALHQFNSIVIQIKEQLLDAFRSSTQEYGQSILADVNRHLSIVHQRLEAIARESAALGPAVKESLAVLNGSASTVAALLASLKVPGTKGEIGEIGLLNSMSSAFLGIPDVFVEPLGGSGDTDVILIFRSNGLELAKVVLENKNRASWSNAYVTQLESDMIERGAHFGILVTTALPKDAKSRGYAIAEKSGIIVITTPEIAPAIALVLYDLIRSLERLSNKGKMLQALLQSRELLDCITSNLSLVEPLRGVIKIMDKAHSDITLNINQIIEAIQRNNARLAESLAARELQEK